MAEPILSLGDLEPERPTVTINLHEPDGPWQWLKDRLLDPHGRVDRLLLAAFPIRYRTVRRLYALRMVSEFGLEFIARIQSMQKEVAELDADPRPEALYRMTTLLREMAGLMLDAPADVLDKLSPEQHSRIVLAFPHAVMGMTPTAMPTENPSTSDDSSPASSGSTAPAATATG